MKYKVGDLVRILHNQGQNTLYRKGDIGKIDIVEEDGSVSVEFHDGCSWWVWNDGDKINGEILLVEDMFELLDPILPDTIERKIKAISIKAETLALHKGYEKEIIPAVELIDKMLDILKEHGILHELTLPE